MKAADIKNVNDAMKMPSRRNYTQSACKSRTHRQTSGASYLAASIVVKKKKPVLRVENKRRHTVDHAEMAAGTVGHIILLCVMLRRNSKTLTRRPTQT
jgi:hypothetical protein